MRLRIHRGAREIGGSCVEVEADGASILIDLGLPLDADEPDPSLLPAISGLTDGSEPRPLGIVISHIHPDHIGLVEFAHTRIPIFVGAQAQIMLRAVQPFLPRRRSLSNLASYEDRQSFSLGPFRVTPYLTDHSAFDAYGLLIEAGGKRVFYSGDFRAHGRKASLVERLMRNPPEDIDVLLLEGTTLSRSRRQASQTEQELEDEIVRHVEEAEGLVLSVFSPQNIDRFVTIFKAAHRAGRIFIGDLYLAQIIRCLDLPSLPRPSRNGFRVYVPAAQRRRVLAEKRFDLVDPYRQVRIFREEIAADPSKWVMLFRESMARELEPFITPSPATIIYSLWSGYLEQQRSQLSSWCAARNARLILSHTSGHADPQDLIRFAAALKPRRIVPLHTTVPHMFEQLFTNATLLNDGEWLSF